MPKDISIYVIIILICLTLAHAYNKQILSQSCEEIKSINLIDFRLNAKINLDEQSIEEFKRLLNNSKVKTYRNIAHAGRIQTDPKYIIEITYNNLEIDKLIDGEGANDFCRILDNEEYVEVENDSLNKFCDSQFELQN